MTYIAAEALYTIRKVKLTNKKDFTNVVLDEDIKAFVGHMSFLTLE